MSAEVYHYSTNHYGVSEWRPDRQRLHELLLELDDADDAEHPDLSVTHSSGWVLTYTQTRNLLIEHLDRPDPRGPLILRKVSHEQALLIFMRLAASNLDGVLREDWQPVESGG